MVCFGSGTIEWNAVSAVGSFFASFVALFVAWLALKAPEWSKADDRLQAIHEILAATNEALTIYREAHQLVTVDNKWPKEIVIPLRIRSTHLYQTLDRLIARPSLTDGPIIVGAGAMSILAVISSLSTTEELRRERGKASPQGVAGSLARYVDSVTPAKQSLEAAAAVVAVVEERMRRVQKNVGAQAA